MSKTIKVNDGMYFFLMTLSEELNKQDNRSTASPYFFQIEDEEEIAAAEGCGDEAWHGDGETLRTEEEIKEAIFEHKEWEIGNTEHEELYKKMDWVDKEKVMEENYRKIFITTQKVYKNVFFTEKACKKHIEAKRHHYTKPVDFLSYSFENPELEKLIEFLKGLTKHSDCPKCGGDMTGDGTKSWCKNEKCDFVEAD